MILPKGCEFGRRCILHTLSELLRWPESADKPTIGSVVTRIRALDWPTSSSISRCHRHERIEDLLTLRKRQRCQQRLLGRLRDRRAKLQRPPPCGCKSDGISADIVHLATTLQISERDEAAHQVDHARPINAGRAHYVHLAKSLSEPFMRRHGALRSDAA
jgi:hypothetical protein